MTFTDLDKLECVERELAMRLRVYANQIRQGRMTRAMADREIALMAAILEDYRAAVQPDLLTVGD